MIVVYTMGGVTGYLISYLADIPYTLGASSAICSLFSECAELTPALATTNAMPPTSSSRFCSHSAAASAWLTSTW